MKYGLKHKFNIITKALILLSLAILIECKPNIKQATAKNNNLNKNNNLASLNILEVPEVIEEPVAVPIVQEEVIEQQVPVEASVVADPEAVIPETPVIATYSGNITGYVFNCPGCSGKLACDDSIDLSGGNVIYNDSTYGNVNIVAASANLACGSIVEITSSMSETPMLAIVLDRGVKGTTLDLLTPSVEYAINKVGNRPATYNVLRNGY